jgi:Sigma-54 interaction domain
MAQPLTLPSVDRSPVRRAFAPRLDEPRHAAKSSSRDEILARLTNANVLVVGAENEAVAIIASLWPSLATPIAVRHRGEPLQLSAFPPVGTFVIHGVETLTREEQDGLHDRLSAGNGRARVVSTASESLFATVESGAFNDALYYRLNVVTIDLTSPVAR